jgi:hypothetical protein
MSSIPRKESYSSLSSTKSAISSKINLKDNKCLYKKEILNTLQKLPDSINKNLLNKISNINSLSEKKDKPITITPLKNNFTNPFSLSNNKNIFSPNQKKEIVNSINDITFKIEELFFNVKNLFCNCKNCVNECEELIELLNYNYDLIIEKTFASEYLPLINNSMNIFFISIILVYCLSDNGKYYLFKFDTNKILENSNILLENIFKRCRNQNEINLKEKSNIITNLYKNILSSLNIIISKLDQIIPSISKNFDSLLKNIRRLNHNEIYNFYKENIYCNNSNNNNKKINEFKLEIEKNNVLKTKNLISHSNKTFINKKSNLKNDIRGLSADNLIKKRKNINSTSSLNSFRTISSEQNINENNYDICNINMINAFSINGLVFPFKKIKNKNHRQYNFISQSNIIQSPINKNIYHTIDGTSSNSHVKIIINESNNLNENDNYKNKSNNSINKNIINNEENDFENNKNKNRKSYSQRFNCKNIFSPIENNKKNFVEFYENIKTREIPIKKNSFTKNINIRSQISKSIKLPIIPFLTNKNYTLLINIDNTLIHTFKNSNKIIIRNYLNEFLSSLIPYYELISFTYGNKKYSDNIINVIEEKDIYFEFNLYKENCTYLNEEYYKDFNKLGRDIKRTIIIEDIDNSFGDKNDNTILIKPFVTNENDFILKNLSLILIQIAKDECDDIRKSLKMYKNEIKNQLLGS